MSISDFDREIWSLSIEESKIFRLFDKIRMLKHFIGRKNNEYAMNFEINIFNYSSNIWLKLQPLKNY